VNTRAKSPLLAGPWLRRLLDSGLMLLYRLSQPMAGVVIYALSMRTYGPELLGKYAYATTMCNLLAPLLVSGVDPLLVRELVRHPERRLELMGSAFVLVLISTVASVCIPSLYILAVDHGDPTLLYMVLGLSVGLLPNSMLVLMSLFRATSKTALATTCGLLGVAIASGFKIYVVVAHEPLYLVAAASVLDPLISGLVLLAAYNRQFGSVLQWRLSRVALGELFRLSWSGVLASFIVTLFFRFSHVMLKSLGSFEQLAYYALAFQMFSVLNFLPNSVLAVAYPRLVQLHQTDRPRYQRVLRACYVWATVAGLVILTGVWLFVSPAFVVLFGAKSAPAAPVAVAMAVANVFTFSGAVRSQVIYIEHKPLYHVYNTVLGFVVLIPLNFLLIPPFGAVGAAAAVACSCFVSSVASSWIIPPLRNTAVDQTLAFFGLRRRGDVAIPKPL
jgi:O-antigen/teichoic acid export membrane protein